VSRALKTAYRGTPLSKNRPPFGASVAVER
jgi:hypothetical protein